MRFRGNRDTSDSQFGSLLFCAPILERQTMLRQSDMQQCYHCCCHRHRHRRLPFYEFHFMRPHYRVYVVVVVLVVVLLVLVLLSPHAMARATAAAPPRFEGMEFRHPRNGTAYTRDEFLDYYGI